MPSNAPTTSMYLLVSSDHPLEAREALRAAPSPPDLCVRSPSSEARVAVEVAFGESYVRTIEEPLLSHRRADESLGDFAKRCADALFAVYALHTSMGFVIIDELPGTGMTPLLLDEPSLLRIAERLDKSALVQPEAEDVFAQVSNDDAVEAAWARRAPAEPGRREVVS